MSAVMHGFDLGALDLASGEVHVESGCKFSVLAAGATFGSPEAVVKAIVSMLADGDLAKYDRAGNRQASFDVLIEAPDGKALADGEVALRRELYRRNTVTWTPPAEFGPPTVYEVLTSSMDPKFDDIDELNSRRVFTLTLTCAPFARSVDLVTIEALGESGVAATVDTCDSATGWTARVNGGSFGAADPAWLGITGAVWVYELGTPGPQLQELIRSGSFAVSSPYLQITVLANEPEQTTAKATVDGVEVELPLLAQFKVTGENDRQVFVFAVDGTTISSLTVANYSYADAAAFGVSDVSFIVRPPGITKRQVTRAISTRGTERTPVSLHLYSDYDMANMQVGIVATWPWDGTGYAPDLRRWRVSGNTVAAAEGDTISLSREPLKPASITCEVPNSALPRDGYVLAVRVQSSTTSTVGIDWAVQTFFPSTSDTNEGVAAGTTPWTPASTGVYEIVPLALLTLPTISGAGGKTRVSFRCLAEDADLFWDEAFLFRVGDDSALTIVDRPPDHVFIDSPDLDSPMPTVREGFAADRSDARHPGARLQAMGNHVLYPDGTVIYAAGITNQPRVAASYYPRWHSNAAE